MDEIMMLRMIGWIIAGICFSVGLGLLFFCKGTVRMSQDLDKGFYPMEKLDNLLKKYLSDKWVISNNKILGVTSIVVAVVFFVMLVMV